jgi:hypothetical protein
MRRTGDRSPQRRMCEPKFGHVTSSVVPNGTYGRLGMSQNDVPSVALR